MRFRDSTALDGVSTAFERDGITGLLGRNGAGKTTLMQLLTGHGCPTRGQSGVRRHARTRTTRSSADICFIKESQRYPDHFRVSDALTRRGHALPRLGRRPGGRACSADFDLPAKRPVKKLSRGMTRRSGSIIGLAVPGPLTLFDEPYLGLDAVARQLFYDRLLADYAEHPRTVVLSTHLIEEIAGLLEHVLLIDRGRVLLDARRRVAARQRRHRDRPRRQGAVPSPASTSSCTPSRLGGYSRAVVRLPRRRRPPRGRGPRALLVESDQPPAARRRDEPADLRSPQPRPPRPR